MNKYVKELVYINNNPHLCYVMGTGCPSTTRFGGYSSDDYS